MIRMRRLREVFLVSLIAVITASACEAKVYTKNWRFSKPIGIIAEGRAAAAAFDDQVYASAKPDLSDLRIVDSGGNEVPFVIIAQDVPPAERRLKTKIVSNQVGELETSLVVEFIGKVEPFNSVELVPKTGNFLRKITLEGSNDNIGWTVIRSGSIVYSIDTTMRRTYLESYTNETYSGFAFGRYWEKSLRVAFPKCEYKLLKVRVPHDKDKAPVELKDLEVYSRPTFEVAEDKFECKIVRSDVPAGGKAVEILADCGLKNLHITRIEMNTGQTNFFRSVDIETSSDMKDWRELAGGAIYKVAIYDVPQESMSIQVPETRDRYLKIKIANGDNPPVTLSGVRCYGKKRYISFIPEADRSYRLLYGNAGAIMPSYDVSYLLGGKMASELGKARLGEQVENKDFKPAKEATAWYDKNPYLLWLAMAIIALGIIFLGAQVITKAGK